MIGPLSTGRKKKLYSVRKENIGLTVMKQVIVLDFQGFRTSEK